MRMPSFSRHSGTATARDDHRERAAELDQTSGPAPAGTRPQNDDRAGYRSGPIPGEEPTTQRIGGRRDTRHDLTPVPADATTVAPRQQSLDRSGPPPAGPRPRASMFATLSLVTGVVAALLVLSGLLAGYGIAVGVLAVLLAVVGVSATRRRHVAGKSDALLGLVLGLGAIVIGIMAMADALSWLSPDTNTVTEVRQWLDNQVVNRF